MLEKTANRFKTIVLVFLVSLISVVFVLQFGGPQAEGCTADGGTANAVKVGSVAITDGELRAQRVLSGFDRFPKEVSQQLGLDDLVLEGVIERILLAKKARRLGLKLSEDAVMAQIAESGTARVSLGSGTPFGLSGGERPVPVQDEDGHFDKDATKRFIQYGLRRSVSGFLSSQVEESLAENLRGLVQASVEISPAEARAAFDRDGQRRSVAYVRFSEAYYAPRVKVNDGALASYDKDNKAKIDKAFAELKKGDKSAKRNEVVERLYRESRAATLAKGAAAAFLARAKTGDESWDTLAAELEKRGAKAAVGESATDGGEDTADDAPELDPLAPVAKTAVSFRRIDAPISGLGNTDTQSFVRSSFALTKVGQLRDKLLRIKGEWLVLRLDEAETKADDAFEQEGDAFTEKLLADRRKDALRYLVHSVRKDAGALIKYPEVEPKS